MARRSSEYEITRWKRKLRQGMTLLQIAREESTPLGSLHRKLRKHLRPTPTPLTAEEQKELLREFSDGAKVDSLAFRYRLGINYLYRVLREAQVTLRNRPRKKAQ